MKKVFFLFICLLWTSMLTACLTYKPITVTVDSDIIKEANSVICFVRGYTYTADINFYGSYSVKSYNGISLDEYEFVHFLRIPSGETVLYGDVSINYGRIIFEGKDVQLKFNFKPGKNYYISPFLLNETIIENNKSKKIKRVYIKIYEVEVEYKDEEQEDVDRVKDFESLHKTEPIATIKTNMIFK